MHRLLILPGCTVEFSSGVRTFGYLPEMQWKPNMPSYEVLRHEIMRCLMHLNAIWKCNTFLEDLATTGESIVGASRTFVSVARSYSVFSLAFALGCAVPSFGARSGWDTGSFATCTSNEGDHQFFPGEVHDLMCWDSWKYHQSLKSKALTKKPPSMSLTELLGFLLWSIFARPDLGSLRIAAESAC